MKCDAFHGSMKKEVCINPIHDATIFQQDFLSEINNMLEELDDLEFIYAHGAQFKGYKLREQHKFDEDKTTRKEAHGCFSQTPSPRRDGGYTSAAESSGGASPDVDIV
jgi:hypothetical protein